MNEPEQTQVPVDSSTMGFFEKLASFMGESSDLHVVIRKTGNELAVALLPKMRDTDSKLTFSSLNIRGPVQEIDVAFFEKLSLPLTKTKAVMVQIENYEATLLKAKADAESAKNKAVSSAAKTAEVKPKPTQPDLFSTGSQKTDSSIQPKVQTQTA